MQGIFEILRRKDEQIAFLRARNLNQARSLLTRSAALTDHKRFIIAIQSKNFENVERLVSVALRGKQGIHSMVAKYQAAAEGVYHPKSYDEEDDMRGLLLWKLGGSRIAGIAHRALGLPALTTLRNRAIMPPLTPSFSKPTIAEIVGNNRACFESIGEVLATRKVVHQIAMFDEIATEKHLRWDDKTDHFLGVCREHGHRASLVFNGEDDLEEVFTCLEKGEVHYAGEVRLRLPQRPNSARRLIYFGNRQLSARSDSSAKILGTMLAVLLSSRVTARKRQEKSTPV